MFVIEMPNGLYVLKGAGTNDFVRDPRDATSFSNIVDAQASRPGHHRDMGGRGPMGRVVSLSSAKQSHNSWIARHSPHLLGW